MSSAGPHWEVAELSLPFPLSGSKRQFHAWKPPSWTALMPAQASANTQKPRTQLLLGYFSSQKMTLQSVGACSHLSLQCSMVVVPG